MDGLVHHDDPALVIPVIEAELQPLARELISAGFTVKDAWGPVQMAVASLLLERDGQQVLFDAERGMTSVSVFLGERRIWLGTAVTAWACSPGGRSSGSPASDIRAEAPEILPWSLISSFNWDTRIYRGESLAQQTRYGLAVCEWLPTADPGVIDAIEAETRVLDGWPNRPAAEKPAATAALVAARYHQALDRYFAGSGRR